MKPKKAEIINGARQGLLERIGPLYLALASFAAAWTGQMFMYYKDGKLGQGLFFLALSAIILVLAAVSARGRQAEAVVPVLPRGIEAALFVIILLTAVAVRLYKISEIPGGCFVDEATNGQDALDIMSGQKFPVYKGNPTHNPTMYLYLIIFVFKFFGWGCTQVREASVILGVLAVPAFYFLLRYMFGVVPALLGAFLLATMRWHINFSRIGFHGIFGVFAVIVALYFFWRAYKERKWQDFILLGITLGLSQYTYQPARLLPFSIILFCIYLAFRDTRFFVTEWKKIILSVLVSMIVFAPLGGYMMKNSSVFLYRQNEVSLLNEKLVKEWYMGKYNRVQAILFSAKTTMLMFNHKGDFNARHNLPGHPMLDFVTALFAFSGLVLALIALNDPLKFLIFILFAGFLQAGFLSIEAPQSLRLIMLIPVLLLFAVLYIDTVLKYAAMQYRPAGRFITAAALALLVVCAGFLNIDTYYNKQAKFRDCWGHFTSFAYEIGRYLIKQGTNVQAAVMMPAYEMRTTEFVMRGFGQPRPHVYSDANSVLNAPFDPASGRDYVYVLPWNQQIIYDSYLKKVFPGAVYTKLANPFNDQEFYFGLRVPLAEMIKERENRGKSGFAAKYYNGMEWAGNPAVVRNEPFIYQDWGMGPIYGSFSGEWNAKLKIRKSGNYIFSYQSSGFGELSVDGRVVSKTEPGGQNSSAGVELKAGTHRLRFRASGRDYYANLKLFWQKPGEASQELMSGPEIIPE